jgi:hypothetical protein
MLFTKSFECSLVDHPHVCGNLISCVGIVKRWDTCYRSKLVFNNCIGKLTCVVGTRSLVRSKHKRTLTKPTDPIGKISSGKRLIIYQVLNFL